MDCIALSGVQSTPVRFIQNDLIEAVNERNGVQLFFQHMGQEHGSKGFGVLLDWLPGLLSFFELVQDSFRSAKVFLPLDLDFARNPVGLTEIPIGSTLGDLLV